MRRVLLFAVMLGVVFAGRVEGGSRTAANTAFAEGNKAYQSGNYAEALRSYRQVLSAGFDSGELYLNLGNSAYKLGELGWAGYYFEQARRREPHDPDIRSNLTLARGEALGVDQFPSSSALLDILVSIEDRIRLPAAVRLGAGLLWVAVGLLLYAWRPGAGPRVRSLRWWALGTAATAVLLISIKAGQASLAPEAMIVRASAAHTEPREDSTVEFRLPAGSPVSLGRQAENWTEVVVSASLRGWIPAESVARFDTPQ